MKNKSVNVEAYKDFLLSSPLFETIANEVYGKDILAMALMSVLCERGIINHVEVNEAFDRILRSRLSLSMEIDDTNIAPAEFLVNEADQRE